MVVFLLGSFLFATSSDISTKNNTVTTTNKVKQITKTPIAVVKSAVVMSSKKKPKISTEPTDPCAGLGGSGLGGSMFVNCENQQHTNPKLNATVQASDDYLIIINNSNQDWTNCDYSIGYDLNSNDFYELNPNSNSSYSSIPERGTIDIPWGDITKNDGTRFNYSTTMPSDLEFSCNYGKNGYGEWTNY